MHLNLTRDQCLIVERALYAHRLDQLKSATVAFEAGLDDEGEHHKRETQAAQELMDSIVKVRDEVDINHEIVEMYHTVTTPFGASSSRRHLGVQGIITFVLEGDDDEVSSTMAFLGITLP